MTGPARTDSPIENYLDDLVAAMTTRRPRELRNLLAETEAHLRDDAEAAVARGGTPQAAEAQAVASFGPVRELVVAEQRQATTLRTVLRQTLSTAVLLGAIGALAVGLSGVLAEVIRLFGGARSLAGVAPDRVLSASDCARWLAANPAAHGCREAAVADWASEAVSYRIAVGVLGALALLAFRWLRRRNLRHERATGLPPAVRDTIAFTLFAVAGVATLGLGVDALVISPGTGAGQWLSAAPVALAAAVIFGRRLVRELRAAA